MLAFGFFVLTGGLFALINPNTGSSGLLGAQSGLAFVVPGDVNNLTTQEMVQNSLFVSFEIAALATLGIFLAIGGVKPRLGTKP
jgi:hypothetical protein